MAVHIEDYPGEWRPGGWFTHEHAHAHPPDQEWLDHKREFSHRHEHRWHPDQRHHHDPAADHDPDLGPGIYDYPHAPAP